MRIDIISSLPHLLKEPFTTSILARAIEKKVVSIHIHDLRKYAQNKHQKIDDYAYGGGGGMVFYCASRLGNAHTFVDFTSPGFWLW